MFEVSAQKEIRSPLRDGVIRALLLRPPLNRGPRKLPGLGRGLMGLGESG